MLAGTDKNEFAITPTINDGAPTVVTVTMPNNAGGSSASFGGNTIGAGQPFTFNLNYGETAQFQAATANDDLNGARIVASRQVAVFSGRSLGNQVFSRLCSENINIAGFFLIMRKFSN